jgi:signal transduction histidine kinase
MALTVLVYLAALGLVNLQLRSTLRGQIADRIALVLNEVALIQTAPETSALGPLAVDDAELLGSGLSDVLVLDVAERLREITSRSATVLGARLFSADGELILPLPPELVEEALSNEARSRMGEAYARYRPAVRLSDLFITGGSAERDDPLPLPVLEAWIPVLAAGNPEPLGTVQLLLDGSGVAEEYRRLDATLFQRALLLGLAGAGVIGGGLAWAFRRLERANRLLAKRTAELVRANTELALAAKTSAVGAVAAHLMHGLKNPLAGLQSFVTSLNAKAAPADQEELREALLTAQRAQQLVQETVRILREESSSVRYDLTIAELVELLSARAAAAAKSFGVEWRVEGTADRALSNREANLILLILENLVRNALEVTPAGRGVALQVSAGPEEVRFGVVDEGPGIPPDRQATLFTPQRSSKPGGAGIGLAISRQLAGHIGARLELESSGPSGTVFALIVGKPRAKG